MNDNLKIISVNLGSREKIQVGDRLVETGIHKHPVNNSIAVNQYGLVGDTVVDTSHHGGIDQAVYLYSQEDYDWWSEALQKDLSPGTFGENITLSGFGSAPLRIGDRFQINRILLEVTFTRIPCSKLAARMDDPGFARRFVQAGRPGAYARVLHGGELRVGDVVSLIPAPDVYPAVVELFNLWYAEERDPQLLKKGLESPIAQRARRAFQRWLDESS